MIFKGHNGAITSLVVLHDGSLASSSLDKTIRIWDTKKLSTIKILTGHTNWVKIIAGIYLILKLWKFELYLTFTCRCKESHQC